MDEIQWIKNTKKAIIYFAKVFSIVGIIMVIIGIIGGLSEPKYATTMIGIGLFIASGFTIFIAISFLVLHIIYKIKYLPRKEVIFEKEYLRELPKQYSPALSSFIYDLKIDIYKDYTATILYLCTKKYIKINKNKDKYEFEILNRNTSPLSESEKYVFDKIINKTKFDEFEFSNKIIEEAKENFFIINKETSKIPKLVFGAIFSIILFIIIYTKSIEWVIFVMLFVAYGVLINKKVKPRVKKSFNTIEQSDYTQYKRTNRGKKLAIELQALKNYINEYTLIKEKDIDYVQILEEYIPYAIALGEASTIEKFIKNNEEYRELIYNRKIDE